MTVNHKKRQFLYLAIFASYLIIQMTVRLLSSTVLHLDDAEQFEYAQTFALGYKNQPPLYTWLVQGIAFFFGLNIVSILATKNLILIGFLVSFYGLSKRFWDEKQAMLITASLVIFPLYGYEFVRHQSHSVLAAFIAALTCLIYARLVERGKVSDYILIGAAAGLGILSKYNFALFLMVFLISILLSPLRRTLFTKNIFFTIAVFIAVVLPHALWLANEGSPSFHFALGKARAGTLSELSFLNAIKMLMVPYGGVVLYCLAFLIFFGKSEINSDMHPEWKRFFYNLGIMSMAVPLLVVFVLQAGFFSAAWLAPMLFTITLALFSWKEIPASGVRSRRFAILCLSTALIMIGVRAVAGFFPDLTGKKEPIHKPFSVLTVKLQNEIAKIGISGEKSITVVSNNAFVASNVASNISGARVLPLEKALKNAISSEDVILFAWDAVESEYIPNEVTIFGGSSKVFFLQAPYLRSSDGSSYKMGFALIQKNSS